MVHGATADRVRSPGMENILPNLENLTPYPLLGTIRAPLALSFWRVSYFKPGHLQPRVSVPMNISCHSLISNRSVSLSHAQVSVDFQLNAVILGPNVDQKYVASTPGRRMLIRKLLLAAPVYGQLTELAPDNVNPGSTTQPGRSGARVLNNQTV